MQRIAGAVTIALVTLGLAGPAGAHNPETDGVVTPIQAAAAHHHQHGGVDGHLPPVQRNVELVGKLDLFGEDEQEGRIADVAAFGNHAYLGAFAAPNCEDPGVYVVDISEPAAPRQVDFIPTSDPSSFVGEGVQVLDMNTEFFQGPVLIYNNETCLPQGNPVLGDDPRLGFGGPGGATLVDVRDPENWTKLSEHVGDEDPPESGVPHNSHSAFGWQQGDKAYMVVVDNAEGGETDIDIFDITNPRAPHLVAETGMADSDWEVTEAPAPNGSNAFVHDMVVKKVGDRYLMLASYWDGGYVVLDVTAPANPTFVGDTDFGAVEPFAGQMGLPADWTPEGNAHQAEFNHDNTLFLGADEDFDAKRVTGKITTGQYANSTFSATSGNAVPPVDEDNPITGRTRFVGTACGTAPPATAERQVALVDRAGGCTFQVKLQTVRAAGYEAGIVFNDKRPDCEAQVFMLAVGDIPFVFVSRSTGLKLLNMPFTDPCETDTPAVGATDVGEGVHMTAFFDGWGYMHLYDAKTMETIDHWALPESLDATKASGFGDLSIHEVAMDPTANRAYVSHYSGGFRVFDFSRDKGIQEVGAFIAEGGNNFWGVEVHPQAGSTKPLVLASDRDSGLWIFRYTESQDGGPQRPAGQTEPQPTSAFRGCLALTANVIQGTTAANKINGTPRAERIFAGTGDDVVDALAGADCVDLGLGDDRGRGGLGDDLVVGGLGADRISGSSGDDRLRGNGSNDRIDAGRGNDRAFGDAGNDVIRGRVGNDRGLHGVGGNDRISGGRGRDNINGGAGRDKVFARSSNDLVRGDRGHDRINGNSGKDRLFGNSGRDWIKGGTGRDVIRGGAGNDRILVRDGQPDRVKCGRGHDNVLADGIDQVGRSCERVRRVR